METILLEIIDRLKEAGHIDDELLAKIIHRHNRNIENNKQHHSKKKLLPYYLRVKSTDPERWAAWGIDEATEKQLVQVLQVKPRRTASGVATITVITKPWKCSSNCLYCPSDVRMPKSYLSDEPACQRAERNFFDPYLQVTSRLRALTQMGHATDKVELIVLGGTWCDYPLGYQLWFVAELFRALNDGAAREQDSRARRRFYQEKGLSNRADELKRFVGPRQKEIDRGALTYNEAIERLYEHDGAHQGVAAEQVAGFEELARQQTINETASSRVVGLVIETRPDAISCDSLMTLRRLGCTKVQIGVQSLDAAILRMNDRKVTPEAIGKAFELLRVFGFKIHAHFMVNLYGSSPEQDKLDYRRFVSEKAFQPDELKLYPCALVKGTGLCRHYAEKTWQPYSEDELIDILKADTLITPPFMRISRMIRDISAHDILAGNTKANLRQMVEKAIEGVGKNIAEIRYREVSTSEIDIESLSLDVLQYETTVSDELFLQWITPDNRIAGFLRLSLPAPDYVHKHQPDLPVAPLEAMIREVHVYGKVAELRKETDAAGEQQKAQAGVGDKQQALSVKSVQHLGLGRQLIEAACGCAKARGYRKVNVISSVGTREYYRSLGFYDQGLYQQRTLSP